MPQPSPVDLVDFSAQREIEKLEAAFDALADMRAQARLQKVADHIGAYYSGAANQEGDE